MASAVIKQNTLGCIGAVRFLNLWLMVEGASAVLYFFHLHYNDWLINASHVTKSENI